MKSTVSFDEKLKDGSELKGMVEFEYMKNSDRLKYLDSADLDMKSGKIKKEITFSADLMNLAAARISTIKLELDGRKITQKSDLEYFSFGIEVLSRVAKEILEGPKFAKKS